MIKVAIVDDHKMFRDGVSAILSDEEDIEVIWSVSSSKETLELINVKVPDVVLMDLSLGQESGFVLTSQILERNRQIKILTLSMHHEDSYIVKTLEMGSSGYLLKDAGREEMVKAIHEIAKGNIYYSQQVSEVLIKHFSSGTKSKQAESTIDLTKREIEILKLIGEEYSNAEIAEMLFISVRTVDAHRRNLLEKLGVKNTAGMIKYAIKAGIVR